MRRRLSSLIAITACLVAVAVPAAGVAAPTPSTSVQISAAADFVNSGTIVVHVAVECSPFQTFPGVLFVSVSQNSTGGTGFAFNSITCDSQKHDYAAIVSGGPFAIGSAFASAQACGFVCGSQDARTIRIS